VRPVKPARALLRMHEQLAKRRKRGTKKCNLCNGTGKLTTEPKGLFMNYPCPRCLSKGKIEPFYPFLCENIKFPEQLYREKSCGQWVAVRPSAKDCGGKTFLGVMLGDFAQHVSAFRFRPNPGQLEVSAMGNPTMYVPDLKRIVWGSGSWWSIIKSPEDLKLISDKDINDVWYVRALRELSVNHLRQNKPGLRLTPFSAEAVADMIIGAVGIKSAKKLKRSIIAKILRRQQVTEDSFSDGILAALAVVKAHGADTLHEEIVMTAGGRRRLLAAAKKAGNETAAWAGLTKSKAK
jgi:hypothetical protein